MAVYQIVQSHGKVIDWIRDHKTDILTYGGIGLMTVSTAVACIGTKHVIEHKEEIDSENALVKRVWERSKIFVAATGFWAGGAYCIHKSHGMLKAENAALTNTVLSMAAGTLAYRNRWKDKVGESEEAKVFFDEKTEEVADENGKKKKVKTSDIDTAISTERFFDRFSSWAADENGDIEYDKRVVRNVQCVLNNKLRGDPEQIVLLNQAYEMLRLFTENKQGQRVDDRSVVGQVAGWIYDKEHPNGDNTIVITITETTRRLEDGSVIPTLRLGFNFDGNIMKAAKERGLLK